MRKYQPRLGLIIVMAAYSMTLFAEQTVDSHKELVLEEIIVTATKREVNLQKLALSVGVLTGQQLTNIGAIKMDDYWRLIPSLNVKDAPGGGRYGDHPWIVRL